MEGYDYIVVGAGSAGCVIAARLSEDPHARVLLLEAGDRHQLPAMAVPAAWPTLQGTQADWADTTVPQSGTRTRVSWPRGRGLGGRLGCGAWLRLTEARRDEERQRRQNKEEGSVAAAFRHLHSATFPKSCGSSDDRPRSTRFRDETARPRWADCDDADP